MNRIFQAIRRRLGGYRALRSAQRDSLGNIARLPVKRILVVCYGNIYRSPFVASYLRPRLPDVEVRSVGFHAKAGRESPPRHVAMAKSRGVDLSDHKSSVISAADGDWADLVVFMDRHNWNALVEYGVPREKLAWLGAFTAGPVEIVDPYGLDDDRAASVMNQMERAAQGLVDSIR